MSTTSKRKIVTILEFVKAAIHTPTLISELSQSTGSLLRSKQEKATGADIKILKTLPEVVTILRKARAAKVKSFEELQEIKNEVFVKKTEQFVERGQISGKSLYDAFVEDGLLTSPVNYADLLEAEDKAGTPFHNGFVGYFGGWFILDEEQYKKALWDYKMKEGSELYTIEEKDENGSKTIAQIRRFNYTWSFEVEQNV